MACSVLSIGFRIFYWYRDIRHRTESDLFLSLCTNTSHFPEYQLQLETQHAKEKLHMLVLFDILGLYKIIGANAFLVVSLPNSDDLHRYSAYLYK